MAAMDKRVAELIYKYSESFSICEDGRVRCDLNGHVFPSAGAFDAVSKFMDGPKFKKLTDKKKTEAKLDKMDPFLVPSRNFPERMWCALTKQLVAADLKTIKRHMQGKKFKNAQKRFQEDKQFLYEEPDMEGGDDEEEEGEEVVEEAEAAGPSTKQGKRNAKKAAVPDAKGKKPAPKSDTAADEKMENTKENGDEDEDDEPAEFWVPEWAEEAAASGDDEDGMGAEGERPPAASKAGKKQADRANGKGKAKAKASAAGADGSSQGGSRKPKKGDGKDRAGSSGGGGSKVPRQPQQGAEKGNKRKNPNKHAAKRPRTASQ